MVNVETSAQGGGTAFDEVGDGRKVGAKLATERFRERARDTEVRVGFVNSSDAGRPVAGWDHFVDKIVRERSRADWSSADEVREESGKALHGGVNLRLGSVGEERLHADELRQ